MHHSTQLIINLASVEHNCNVVKKLYPNKKTIAVVKANAYGSQILEVSKKLQPLVDAFAVFDINEALLLKKHKIAKPILILNITVDGLPIAQENGFYLTIHSLLQIENLKKNTQNSNIKIFLKINTGMNRLGLDEAYVSEAIKMLNKLDFDEIILTTHLMSAKVEYYDFVSGQIDKIKKLSDIFKLPLSIANSAAVMSRRVDFDNWQRIGIMLYGTLPIGLSPNIKSKFKGLLKPVITFKSSVIAIQNLQKGDFVGYDGEYRAKSKSKVALVEVGYSDGYPLSAKTGTPITVCGHLTTTVGQVSMNMLAADITHIDDAKIGSDVELWGHTVDILEVAKHSNLSPHKLLSGLKLTIPRQYIN